MSKRRWLALLAIVAVVSAACTGGGEKKTAQKTPGEVTLTFWVTEEGQDEYSKALINAFEAKYPNIHIDVTAFPEAHYGTKVDLALAAGNPPDLGSVGNLEWMRAGKVLPLDDMVKQQGIDLSTFNKSIVGDPTRVNAEFGCSYGGHLYCLGSYLGAVGVFYNKDMFDAAGIAYPAPWPPMTIDQFVATACKLTDKAAGVWGGAYGYPVTVLPWETEFSTDGKTAVVNDATSVHAYGVMAQGIRNGCAPSLNVMDPWEQGNDYFTQGKLAMVVTDLLGIKKIEKAGINYGVTGPPTAPGVEPFLQTWTDGIGIFAGTEHPAEAKLFVAFHATEGQKLRVQTTGDFPLDAAVAKATNWAGDIPGRQDIMQILPNARPAVFIPNRWNTVGPVFDAFDKIVGGESAQQALSDAEPATQQNLDKEWKIWDEGA